MAPLPTTWLPTTWMAASALALAVVGLAVAVAAYRRGRRLQDHYRALMEGVDGADLAAALEVYGRRLGGAEADIAVLAGQAAGLDRRLRLALQRVGVLRFNAFDDVGGEQSFAIAFLDESGNGVVVSGLQGRDGGRVFAKPVRGGRSQYALSAEEERAIAAAGGEPPVAPGG